MSSISKLDLPTAGVGDDIVTGKAHTHRQVMWAEAEGILPATAIGYGAMGFGGVYLLHPEPCRVLTTSSGAFYGTAGTDEDRFKVSRGCNAKRWAVLKRGPSDSRSSVRTWRAEYRHSKHQRVSLRDLRLCGCLFSLSI